MTAFRLNLMEHGRALEWLTSSVLLGFALTLALPGDTLAGQGFVAFRKMGLDEAMIGVPLAFVSTQRLAALHINGAWRRSPVLRMIGAVIGCGIFAMLAMAFGLPYIDALVRSALWDQPLQVGPSTGAAVYSLLAAADALATHRSAADVGFARRLP